jgi:PTS system nitrogen regulatory IIA component
MPHRTLDLTQAAQFLHLQPAQVERLVKDREIPCEQRGGKVVFRPLEIQRWASRRILGLEGRRLQDYHGGATQAALKLDPKAMRLGDWIRPNYIQASLPAKTRASVLREMVKVAEATGQVTDGKSLLTGLEEREDLCSTGLPGGWALLHTRDHDPYLFETPVLALGRTVQAIPFGAPDGRATHLFFLLGCTDDRLHLHALARLCLLAQKTELIQTLLDSPDAMSMFEAFKAAEVSVLDAPEQDPGSSRSARG